MTPPTDLLTIRRAAPADLDRVAGLLAAAFHGGDLADWLIPDPTERAQIYPGYFGLLAEHALTHGLVDVADDLPVAGVAVWYEHSATNPPIENYDARLATAVGRHLARFRALDAAMHATHPADRPHHYLAFLAVHPDQQGNGLGGNLLRHHHHRDLDATGRAAYLEATGPRNRLLYLRHGYQPRTPYQIGNDGPLLFPMWREPNTAGHRTRRRHRSVP